MQVFRWTLLRAEQRGRISSPALLMTALDTGQDILGFLGCECILLAHVMLVVPPNPCAQGCSQSILHLASLCAMELTPLQFQDLHLALLNFTRLTKVHLISLARSLGMASLSSSVLTSCYENQGKQIFLAHFT